MTGPLRVLGLMSGTSVDGVDAAVAVLRLRGDTLHLAPAGELTVPWPERLRERVLAVLPPAHTTAGELCRLHHDLGRALARAAGRAADRLGPVDLVASHGQTVHHDVAGDGNVRGTLQLGQAAEIAEHTGLPVVADLRARDVAAGGQGAPLVSMLDQLLLRPAAADGPVGALNLGGIANLTVLRPPEPTLAFDCGPANALLDAAVAGATGQRYDESGALAAGGTASNAGPAVLAEDPFLAAPPPKSTGKERYHAGFLAQALARAPVAELADLLATLAEHTAAVVAADAARYGVRRVWVSGGGVHHAGLLEALRRRLAAAGAGLAPTSELGLPVDHKEAYAFAVLGWLTWHGLPGSLPGVTGAAGGRVLGALVPGAGPLRLPEPLPTGPHRLVVGE